MDGGGSKQGLIKIATSICWGLAERYILREGKYKFNDFLPALVKDYLVEIKRLNMDSSITDKKTDIIITKISVLDKY